MAATPVGFPMVFHFILWRRLREHKMLEDAGTRRDCLGLTTRPRGAQSPGPAGGAAGEAVGGGLEGPMNGRTVPGRFAGTATPHPLPDEASWDSED